MDDCQQLLQVLFTTEEPGWITSEMCKTVPDTPVAPTTDQACIDDYFPYKGPSWDYNMAAGKERLLVYCQTLLAGLKAVARWPTNLAKVYDVRQGTDESPAAFLGRINEAFRRYTHVDQKSLNIQVRLLWFSLTSPLQT